MTLYFFTFQTEDGLDYEAVENAEQAAKYAAAGWCAVSHETFMDAWKRRDARDFAAMWAELPISAPRPRMTTAPIERLPNGWSRYSV